MFNLLFYVFRLVPGPKIHSSLKGCEVVEGEDAHFFIELSAAMVGTWFLSSTQLQHGGRFSIQQSQTKHTLVIHETRITEDKAEVTFIANGVRDSAVLRVTRRCNILLHSTSAGWIFFGVCLFCVSLQPRW